jgi:hypothetical protein
METRGVFFAVGIAYLKIGWMGFGLQSVGAKRDL